MAETNTEKRIVAKTLEAALKEAARELNTAEENISYRLVSQSAGGLFSFLGRKIEIAAWKKSLTGETVVTANKKSESTARPVVKPRDIKASAQATVAPKAEKKAAPRYEADDEDERNEVQGEVAELTEAEVAALVTDLTKFFTEVVGFMGVDAANVTSELKDSRLVIDVNDDYLAQQIGKNSKLAESLEHVLRKKPRHLKRELPFRIFVDAKGMRQSREDDLISLAQDLSRKVAENRRPIVLPYKSSYDRKIIHMALDKDERVYTKSIGTGPNRKLMICPIKKRDEAEAAPLSE